MTVDTGRLPAVQLDSLVVGDPVTMSHSQPGASVPTIESGRVARLTSTQVVVTCRSGERKYRKADGTEVGTRQLGYHSELMDPASPETRRLVRKHNVKVSQGRLSGAYMTWTRRQDDPEALEAIATAVARLQAARKAAEA